MFLKCWNKKGLQFHGVGSDVTNEAFQLGWDVMWLLNDHKNIKLLNFVVDLHIVNHKDCQHTHQFFHTRSFL